MLLQELDTLGATVRTLRAFMASWHDRVALIRGGLLPDPDVRQPRCRERASFP